MLLGKQYMLFDLKNKYLIVRCIVYHFNNIHILFKEHLHLCTNLMKSFWKNRSIHQQHMSCFVYLWAYLKLCILCVKVQKSSVTYDKLGRGQKLLQCSFRRLSVSEFAAHSCWSDALWELLPNSARQHLLSLSELVHVRHLYVRILQWWMQSSENAA